MSRFTAREMQVAELLAESYTWAEVAEELGISTSTVRAHVDRMFVKLRGRPIDGRKSRLIARSVKQFRRFSAVR